VFGFLNPPFRLSSEGLGSIDLHKIRGLPWPTSSSRPTRFRHHYRQRLAAERVFSRLLALAMQHPTIKGLHAIQNYCTIAHITTCLVALTAHREGHPDKLRFVRTFVPSFLSEK
jgi:hypothetical protein